MGKNLTDDEIVINGISDHIDKNKNNSVSEKLVISEEKRDESDNSLMKKMDTWGFFMDAPSANVTTDTNKIYYNGEICSSGITTLIEKTRELNDAFKQSNAITRVPLESYFVELYITSPGGAVSEGFRYIDFVEKNKINIKTIAFGTVASMGFVLWLMGNERYISKHSHILIHQMSSGFQGKRSDILDYLKHLEDIQADLMEYIADKTGFTVQKVEEITSKETWLTAKEVVSMKMGKIWE